MGPEASQEEEESLGINVDWNVSTGMFPLQLKKQKQFRFK